MEGVFLLSGMLGILVSSSYGQYGLAHELYLGSDEIYELDLSWRV